jgi:hypothetical protein
MRTLRAAQHPEHETAPDLVQNISNSLTLRKPSWATNGQTCAFGDAHDLP